MTPPSAPRGTLTLIVPMPKNIANGAHGHYMGRHREKVSYWRLLDLMQGRGHLLWRVCTRDAVKCIVPPPPKTPFAKASIRSTMYLGAAMDDSNAMRRHKWIEDYLKTRGYIKDDRRSCLKWEGFPEQIVRRDGNYRIEITLANLTV